MFTSFKPFLALVTLGVAGVLATSDASASTPVTYEFSYPGTQCNSFGASGMGPNGGAELVNWSNPGAVLVECPFMRDSNYENVNNTIFLDYSSNVTCSRIYSFTPGKGIWAFAPTSISLQNGYNTYNWGANFNPQGIAGAAVECQLAPLGTIIDYRVNTLFLQNPGK